MLTINMRETIITVLLVTVMIALVGTAHGFSLDGAAAPSQLQEIAIQRKRLRKRTAIMRLQLTNELAIQRLIHRITLFVGCVGLGHNIYFSQVGTLDYFSTVPILMVGQLSNSGRVDTMVTESSYSSLFAGSVRLEVPKDNMAMRKIIALTLFQVVVPPAPGSTGHRLSLREIALITGLSIGTVSKLKKDFDAEGLDGLVRKKRQDKTLQKEIQQKIIELQIQDPVASCQVIANRINEAIQGSDVTSEQAAKVLTCIDFNKIRPAIRRICSSGHRSSYLIDQLFDLNRAVLDHATNLPKSILVKIEDLRSIHHKSTDQYHQTRWSLEEERQSSTNIARRNQKEQSIKDYLTGDEPLIRCPYCNSIHVRIKETRSNVVTVGDGTLKPTSSTRYYCLNAECQKKTFTLPDPERELGAQVTKDVKVQALDRTFHFRSSLRHATLRFFKNGKGVGHSVVLRWMQQEAKALVRWYNLFTPRCSGTILVDEKWVKFDKQWHYVYVAVDPASHDLLHIKVMLDNSINSAKVFLSELKAIGFQPEVIVTDSLGGYSTAIKTIYPTAQHIECLIHAERAAKKAIYTAEKELEKEFGKELEQEKVDEFKTIKNHLHKVFASTSKDELDRHWEDFMNCSSEPDTKELIRKLENSYTLALRAIQSPTKIHSTNAVERVILEFERKYSQMQAFSSFGSMQCWCVLFQLYYRMRPFERGRHKGQSPAQVMGYPVENLEWVDFVLGPVPSRSDTNVA